jgi:hypothetical protein
MNTKFLFVCLLLLISGLPAILLAQEQKDKLAAKPLFRDPIYDGAADPTVIWNQNEQKWFMFYTNRLANVKGLDGVSWVHGTRIGIAESSDGGATWTYRDTCDIQYRLTDYTHWAPEVVENNGLYHMYLSYVPGVFTDWNHPRWIVHLTSKNLINWKFESKLNLSSDRCIDACVFRLPDGTWRMYYNNEVDGKSMYYADSPDLYKWTDSSKKVVGDQSGEGPNVFRWKGKNWMIVDNWSGLGVYSSDDYVNWKRQEKNILKEPGKGLDDKVIGGHADVVVNGDKAYIFYFTHPGRTRENEGKDNYQTRRSSIQVAELEYIDGQIVCNRDKPVHINLQENVFMFSYFKNNGEDGLHLAYSYDGYKWNALKNDSSFLTPTVSKDKLMRDPCIIKGADNLFHMVWTVSWNDKGIGYASSKDLIHWSEQQFIPVMSHEPGALNCWAPEVIYDSSAKQYMIYWATTIPGRFAATDSAGDEKYNHRIYYVLTKDFKSFSKAKILYDKGFNVIDATIQPSEDGYVMFLKDETLKPVAQKNLHVAFSKHLTDGYGAPSEVITGKYWAEGPTAIKIDNEWVVYFDKYTQGKYGAVSSADLQVWKDISDKISFPEGIRHGTVFSIPENDFKTWFKP